jgi:small subunit ribosomal protein S10e
VEKISLKSRFYIFKIGIASPLIQLNMVVALQKKKIIYTQIFKDGVFVIKKGKNFCNDVGLEIENFIVIKLMKGLLSKGFVNETFNWKFYYFILNEKGVNFLRRYLNIPENVVPMTFASKH